MTVAHQVVGWLGMPPYPDQLGFLLSMLVAFALGWVIQDIRYYRRLRRWKRALWRGERLVRR